MLKTLNLAVRQFKLEDVRHIKEVSHFKLMEQLIRNSNLDVRHMKIGFYTCIKKMSDINF